MNDFSNGRCNIVKNINNIFFYFSSYLFFYTVERKALCSQKFISTLLNQSDRLKKKNNKICSQKYRIKYQYQLTAIGIGGCFIFFFFDHRCTLSHRSEKMRKRTAIAWGVAILCFVVLMLVTPAIPQSQEYHDFADKREFLGIFFLHFSSSPYPVSYFLLVMFIPC